MTRFGVSSKSFVFAVVMVVFCLGETLAEIKITNATARPLKYRIRFPGKNWSAPYELGSSQTHQFAKPENLEIKLEGDSEERIWNLRPDNSYEYGIKSGQSKADFHNTSKSSEVKAYTTPDQPSVEFPNREFKILVMADQTFRDRNTNWKARADEIVAGASRYYEKTFNTRLSMLDCQPWSLRAEADNTEELTLQLYKIDPGEADLVLGVVGINFKRQGSRSGHLLGRAPNFGQHAFITDALAEGEAIRVLVHELGHVLGAFHVDDVRSIMHPDAHLTAVRFQFGKTVMEVFEQTRTLNLKRGVESLTPESALAIKQLFAKAHHPNESGGIDPVGNGYVYQSLRAKALEDRAREKLMAKRALEWSPDASVPHLLVGVIAMSEERSAAAREALRQATRLDPLNGEAWASFALTLLDEADVDAAKLATERAWKLNPQSPRAIIAKAWIEFLTEGINEFQQLLPTLKRVAPSVAKQIERKSQRDTLQQLNSERAIRNEAARAKIQKNSLGLEFVLIQPAETKDQGRFEMGSLPSEEFRSPSEQRHWVRLTQSFAIGVTEVTQGQYERVMEGNPSGFNTGEPELPVENVTWSEATDFCRRLSDLPEEQRAGRRYRLPTEAEWEYACRAGSASKYHFGDDDFGLREYAWLTTSLSPVKTHAVAQRAPNRWGLYDMLGNVAEWCSDWYDDLPSEEQTDPTGPTTGEHRVIRGEYWNGIGGPPRSATRDQLTSQEKSNRVGFRVVMVAQ